MGMFHSVKMRTQTYQLDKSLLVVVTLYTPHKAFISLFPHWHFSFLSVLFSGCETEMYSNILFILNIFLLSSIWIFCCKNIYNRKIPLLPVSNSQKVVLDVHIIIRHINIWAQAPEQKADLNIHLKCTFQGDSGEAGFTLCSSSQCILGFVFFRCKQWRNVAMPPCGCSGQWNWEGGHCGWQEAHCHT